MRSDQTAETVVSFGPFRLYPAARLLERDGTPVDIGGRALDILILLAESAGEVVGKKDLVARVWADVTVDEGSLRFHVSALRKALGDGKLGARYVVNVPGRGYCLAVPIFRPVEPPAPGAKAPLTGHSRALPPRLASMVGRDETVRMVTEALSTHRFVTVVGPGGIGKTTVAMAAGRALSPAFDDQVWFVDLGPLGEPRLVPAVVASTLGLMVSSDDPVASLIASVQDKRLLLILDNCEHVIEPVAVLAETLFSAAPLVHILATSRESLRVEGEHTYRLFPLPCPPQGEALTVADVLGFPAAQLFIERATAAGGDVALTDADAPSVADICHRVDGIPLAIELAAARVDVFGVKELSARLEGRLLLTTRGRRTAMPRHQTLRATLDWSYDLLPDTEQLLLRHLAVFSAGFSIDAALAVATDTGLDLTIVAGSIAALVSKSLLALDRSAPDSRWYLLETIRAYAMEKLTESGEYPATARRHAEYLRDLIVPVAVNAKVRLDASNGSRCGRELDNVRAALKWAFSPEGDAAIGVTLTAAFAPIWVHLSLVRECRDRVEQLRAIQKTSIHLSAPLERRMCIAYSMSLTMTLGSLERNRAAVIRAQELAEGVGDIDLQVHLLWSQWAVETNSGDYVTALVTAQRLAEVAQRGSDATRLLGDRYLGTSLLYAGRLDEARDRLQRVIDRYTAPTDGHHAELFIYDQHLLARSTSARVVCLLGDVDRASAEARLCFEEASAAGAGFGSCRILQDGVWPVALITGDLVAAARATATMIDWATKIDAPLWKMVGNCWNGKLLIERGEFEQGVELVSQAVEACERTGWLRGYAEILGHLAEGLAGLGKLDAAHDAIERAIDRAAHSGEVWHLPELMRIKGEMLLQWSARAQTAEAEDCFRKASELARAQGALFWELRIALSLARMDMTQGRADRARQLLASVYGRFTEGFEVPDLRAAKELLNGLSS